MFDLIQNTKPEIILSISAEYLDSCGNDTPATSTHCMMDILLSERFKHETT